MVLSDYEFQSLVVLPSIRLNHLRQAVEKIVGDRDQVQAVLEAVEQHIEQDAYRWGNACPQCHTLLLWTGNDWSCLVHGFISRSAPVELLIAFKPS